MSRILIVEDEVAIADLEKDYLELSGFEVEIENEGDKGLRRSLEEEFDLIILDLMLPGVDGFEICRQIRIHKNTPVIMVSAKKDDIDKIRGLGLGADDYMTKPFSPSELVARVKAHLARYERLVNSNVQENDIIEVGSRSTRPHAVSGLTERSVHLRQRSLIFLPFSPSTRIMCLQRRSCSAKFGIWSRSAILQQSPSISKRFVRRSKSSPPNHSISRQYGA